MEFKEGKNIIPVEFNDNSENEGDVYIKDIERIKETFENKLKGLQFTERLAINDKMFELVDVLQKKYGRKELEKTILFHIIIHSSIKDMSKMKFDIPRFIDGKKCEIGELEDIILNKL